jgi:hypothetical protein
VKDKADLLEVSVTRNRTAPEKKGDAEFIVTTDDYTQGKLFFVSQKKSVTVEEGKIKLLRLRGIAGVPWMDKATYKAFTELLEGPLSPRTLSSFTARFKVGCRWKNRVFLPGLEEE